jgi:tRNA threonylcarbamoyladenosine dehydratase
MTTTPTTRRFDGLNRVYGASALDHFAAAHVCVIGIGGVGSWAAEALARSGIGRLTLIDMDHIAESNINRQAHALETTLGHAKVVAMAARIAQINPHCQVTSIDDFIRVDAVAAQVPTDALVLDAIDQMAAKAALIACCRTRGQAIVTTGGAGGRRDPTRIRIADLARVTHDPLASSLRTRLRRDYGFPIGGAGNFDCPCVYSDEAMVQPAAGVCASSEGGALNCAGYGSSMCVTAAFGCAAASQILTLILNAVATFPQTSDQDR